MPQFQRGDIVFVSNNSWLSKLVRLFSEGRWSHVGIALNEYTLLDARYPKGVKPRFFDYTDYDVVRVEDINVSKAIEYIGVEYDLLQFIYYGFKWGKVWNNPNKMICSEFVAKAIGRNELINMTPNQLYKELIKLDSN